VLNDERLSQTLLEFLPQQPREQPGHAARRERYDEAHGTAGILLGIFVSLRASARTQNQRHTNGQYQANDFHREVPAKSNGESW
jgi:hypothetical protein